MQAAAFDSLTRVVGLPIHTTPVKLLISTSMDAGSQRDEQSVAILTSHQALLHVLTLFVVANVTRHENFCNTCHKYFSTLDPYLF